MAVLSDGFKRVSNTEIWPSTVSINSNFQYDFRKCRIQSSLKGAYDKKEKKEVLIDVRRNISELWRMYP